MISLITIEHTLARGDDLKTAPPHRTAKVLYDALRTQTQTIALTKADPGIAEWWLKREHMFGWARSLHFDPNGGMTWDEWRIDQVRAALADSWEIFTFVDASWYVAEEVRALGVSVLAVSFTTEPPGQKDPTTVPRPWAEAVSTLDAGP